MTFRAHRIDKSHAYKLMDQGLRNPAIAIRLGCSQPTVSKLRRDYEEQRSGISTEQGRKDELGVGGEDQSEGDQAVRG